MSFCPESDVFIDQDHIGEIAGIFANGVLRLRKQRQSPPESDAEGLELCSTSCPHPVPAVDAERKDEDA
jgi:hypothetical protein